ncbi:MAG: hypothetical protein ACLU3U_10205 [Gallintestinimicrobium sp.]
MQSSDGLIAGGAERRYRRKTRDRTSVENILRAGLFISTQHLHLESTTVTPNELGQHGGTRFGTTTIIVRSPRGGETPAVQPGLPASILDQTEKSPANVYVMMPS